MNVKTENQRLNQEYQSTLTGGSDANPRNFRLLIIHKSKSDSK